MRAVDRHEIHSRQHLVERIPIGRFERFLDLRRHSTAIVIVDRHAEGARAARHRLADASHADNAETLAGNAVPQHPGRRPAGPLPFGNDARAFHQPPRRREDQRHRHVRRVLGQDAGRVGDRDAAAERAGDVDMIDPVAEIRDEPHLFGGLGDHGGVDLVGDGRHQNVGLAHRLDDLHLGHRLIFEIEASVEQFAHAGFDEFGQSPRDHNKGFFLGHERRSYRSRGAAAAVPAGAIISFRAFTRVHAALTTDDANG
jgi:hypothetical protein